MSRKFDDCASCAFSSVRASRSPCSDCDMGEFYEDRDGPGVDSVFVEQPMRFGEPITTDEPPKKDEQD